METSSPPIPDLVIRPLTPRLMDAMGQALKGSWGATCWCLYPRMSDREMRELPGDGPLGPRRRAVMTRLARKRRAPGLLAFVRVSESPGHRLRKVLARDFSKSRPVIPESPGQHHGAI